MFFIKYGKEYLYNPKTDTFVSEPKISTEINSSGSFSFKIQYNHPLYDKLIERDSKHPVTVWTDKTLLFIGDILSIEDSFQLTKTVEGRGILGWLNDSIVRPYSTITTESNNVAPNGVAGYFDWLIEQHNEQVEKEKRFLVGINEGQSLDDYIYRSDTTYPTTGSTIKDKILDTLGGYLIIREYENQHVIDLIQDFPNDSAQLIDFGINLLDYSCNDDSDGMATFVIPVGETMEKDKTDYTERLSRKLCIGPEAIADLRIIVKNRNLELIDARASLADAQKSKNDAQTNYNKASSEDKAAALERLNDAKARVEEATYNVEVAQEYYDNAVSARDDAIAHTTDGYPEEGFCKHGDMIYNVKAVEKYGFIGVMVNFDDVGYVSNLIDRGVMALKSLMSPIRTIEVKAIDLSMIKPDYDPIYVGQYVRVRSKPHNFDSYMLCTKIDYDLDNPAQNTFTLGQTFDLLTGQQNRRINELNKNVAHVYQKAEKISDDLKTTAKDLTSIAETAASTATEAKTAADTAQTTADTAQTTADEAKTTADAAQTTADAAQTTADDATSSAETAKSTANTAKTASDEAKAAAQAAVSSAASAAQESINAKRLADAATTQVVIVESKATEAKTAADSASAAALEAKNKADEADTKAGTAIGTANAAKAESAQAIQNGEDILTELSGQITEVTETMEADYSKKTDLTETEATLRTEITSSAAGISQTVEANYAKKTDLTETESDLQTQINQNAAEISSHASSLTTLNTEVNNAKANATAAATAAATAQTTANTAKTNADTAKTAADEANAAAVAAQSAAGTAQTAASNAQTKANEAASNLALAETKLAEVQAQANATDEDLTTAQAAVVEAKSAADSAQADATAAASAAVIAKTTADTATANAATAQTTANQAKTNAATAQSKADEAKAAADLAQDAVDDLGIRVTAAETSITQNSEQIALRATKTEAQGYANTAVDNLEIGGKNLLKNSNGIYLVESDFPSSTTRENGKITILTESRFNVYKWITNSFSISVTELSSKVGSEYSFGMDYRITNNTKGRVWLYFQFRNASSVDSGVGIELISDGQWHRATGTLVTQSTDVDRSILTMDNWDDESAFNVGTIIEYKNIKIEKGSKATDWTPAPEDMDEQIGQMSDDIQNQMTTQETSILEDSESIILSALESYVETDDLEGYKSTVSSQLELLKDQIEIKFNKAIESANAANDKVESESSNLSKYIRFSLDGIEIGEDERSLKLTLDNDKISFTKNGAPIGWWDGSDFHTGNIVVEVNEKAQFGDFAYIPRSDGSLMFIKIGG